jgi:putative membrane protein
MAVPQPHQAPRSSARLVPVSLGDFWGRGVSIFPEFNTVATEKSHREHGGFGGEKLWKVVRLIPQPAWNAILNGLSAILVIAGYVMIRSKRVQAHKICMLAAVGTSTAFLISYVDYHLKVGSVRFPGQGMARTGYLTMLGTHTTLAAAIVPLVIITLVRALRGRFADHKRIARWTLPLWAYVSVTGVLIYLLLYQVYAAPHP